MATNDIPELEVRDSELPHKEEVCGVFNSSTTYESLQGGWGANRVNGFDDLKPLMRSEAPLNAAVSKAFERDAVRELTIKNYKKPPVEKKMVPEKNKCPVIGGVTQPRNAQWSHLYQLARVQSNDIGFAADSLTRARDQLMMNARESSGRSKFDMLEIRRSNDARNVGLKLLPTANFSPFFRNVKGKEIMGGEHMNRNLLDAGIIDVKDDRNPESPFTSNAPLNHGATIKQFSQESVAGVSFDSSQGFGLREWLRSDHSSVSKAERLFLFGRIVEIVDNAHSQGVVLLNLWPSSFVFLPSKKVKYIGSSARLGASHLFNTSKKHHIESDIHARATSGLKQQKVLKDASPYQNSLVTSGCQSGVETVGREDCSLAYARTLMGEKMSRIMEGHQNSFIANLPLEKKWYTCPEQSAEKRCATSFSNIYCLGLLAFELLCSFDSADAHSAAMLDVHQRIFPPLFLAANPKEVAFIMWLLHPEPSLRPTTREILTSELICQSEAPCTGKDLLSSENQDDSETELLMDFLKSLREKKHGQATKLVEDISFLEADIKEAETRYSLRASSDGCNAEKGSTSDNMHESSDRIQARLFGDFSQLENAYFSKRSQTTRSEETVRSDKGTLKHIERASQVQNHSVNQKSEDRLGVFFKGLCQYTRYSRFEVCGSVRNRELLNSAGAICSLSFDRDEDYIAAAGVSKKIKIFDLGALLHQSSEVHYPAIELVNGSKISCISWNSYTRNYLASTDYDGVVKIWDASTGTLYSQYTEHQKRAWSVDFSQMDPTKFATGSDDCSVKLWSANEKNSVGTLWSPANVCSVQFSPYSSHLLAFGSADYMVYGYDLRHTRIPWCTFPGHQRAVSYVKFMDQETLVSASTDHTLKLWDLNKTSLSGSPSEPCTTTFTGHTNEKNFVGLSVQDGYIVCGSETNEVFAYHKFLPTPITSHKFGSVNPISGEETTEDNPGSFVSSVCWKRKSSTVAVGNSSGSIKILQLV